jgi:hypothetical protein
VESRKMEQSEMKKIYMVNKRSLAAISFICLAFGTVAYGYEGYNHTDITGQAINNYINWASNYIDVVGEYAISCFSNTVIYYSVHEDDGVNWLQHFMDPVTGNGWGGNPSALSRALVLWYEGLDWYKEGNYALAYERLGRVIHLVEDMGVPAHVQLDAHWWIFGWDMYEARYAPENPIGDSGINNPISLPQIINGLANTSDYYDSNDVDGVGDQGNRRAGGLEYSECPPIAQTCYRGAIRSSGAVLKLFYDTVSPAVGVVYEPQSGTTTSGLVGISCEVTANSYGNNNYIRFVDVYYNRNDDQSGLWYWAAILYRNQQTGRFTGKCKNGINDSKVWICFKAVDNGSCDGIPVYDRWVKIDSARPTVTNRHK